MTDDVAKLVLAHNIDQNIALACGTYRSSRMAASHEAWMKIMEAHGRLNRGLESLPTSEQMAQRIASGKGLTRPELCSLLAWTKIWLADLILESDLPDDPYLSDRLTTYFPKALRERYADAMAKHRLHREIVATVTVNRFVNSQGITSFFRLSEETSSTIEQIVRAQLAARNICRWPRSSWACRSPASIRTPTLRSASRSGAWSERQRGGCSTTAAASSTSRRSRRRSPTASRQCCRSHRTHDPRHREGFEKQKATYLAGGVAPELAEFAALARYEHMALPIVQTAQRTGRDLMETARVMFKVAEVLGMDMLFDRIGELPIVGRWDLMAQAAMRDDLQKARDRHLGGGPRGCTG